MRPVVPILTLAAAVFGAAAVVRVNGVANAAPKPNHAPASKVAPFDVTISQNAQRMMDEGRQTFRFETFGDEAFWSDGLGLDRAIQGEKNGGVAAA